jgi:hypothetical protein
MLTIPYNDFPVNVVNSLVGRYDIASDWGLLGSGLVVRVPGYPEVPGSIPGAITYSEN